MLKSLVGRLFGRSAPPSYEAARGMLEEHSAKQRRQLADSEGVAPEILYFLAGDTDPEIRRRVAANGSTPMQADRHLAEDSDEDVRAALARKIARLVPRLDEDEGRRTSERVLELLERLARDQAPRVRTIVAHAIKASRAVPAVLVRRLAQDAEAAVAGPILEYSPLLSDADLIEIIQFVRVSETLSAIARRRGLSASVCDALIATLDISATAALLLNPDADISASALEALADQAAQIESWHHPLATRPNLSTRVVRRIAGFVSASLIEVLASRRDLDPEVADALKQDVRHAIDKGRLERTEDMQAAQRHVEDAAAHGALDDYFVAAAAESGDRETVLRALAERTGLTASQVRKVLDARNARTVTALVWKAKLAMRVSVAIQTAILKLPTREMLPARGGTDFPLTQDEMRLHLELFGIKG